MVDGNSSQSQGGYWKLKLDDFSVEEYHLEDSLIFNIVDIDGDICMIGSKFWVNGNPSMPIKNGIRFHCIKKYENQYIYAGLFIEGRENFYEYTYNDYCHKIELNLDKDYTRPQIVIIEE